MPEEFYNLTRYFGGLGIGGLCANLISQRLLEIVHKPKSVIQIGTPYDDPNYSQPYEEYIEM